MIFDCDVHQGDGTAKILEKNNDIFRKNLRFNMKNNKITIWMSMHIIKSFASEDWDADPPLTRDMREIFNDIMNMEIPPHEREYFDPNNLKFEFIIFKYEFGSSFFL